MRGEDGYNESLHSLVVNVQAGANGRAERDVAAELLQDVARPDRRITKQVWALRKVVFGTLYESRTWTSFLRRLHGARLRKKCPWAREFSEKSSSGCCPLPTTCLGGAWQQASAQKCASESNQTDQHVP